MRCFLPAVAAAVVGILAGPSGLKAGSDVIELKDGHQLVGEVVAEKAGTLFVDLGFDIVKVPKDQVVSRRKGDEAAKPASAAAGTSMDVDPTGFYKTGDLKATPVKDLVRKFGEAERGRGSSSTTKDTPSRTTTSSTARPGSRPSSTRTRRPAFDGAGSRTWRSWP